MAPDEPRKTLSAKDNGDSTAKSDHGDNKAVGFFANFRRHFAKLGRKETTRSQGVIDHIDQVDLMDLAADLGCISAEDEKSFTFKAQSTSQDKSQSNQGGSKYLTKSDQKHSNGMTFSDHELEVNSNYDGNIVCKKPSKKL